MHKFAVIHKHSGIVCYSTNREIRNFEPGFNYEIVNNSNKFKTISPDLNFSDYAEIADAINLSDKLTFTKGDDDILTISDNARSVSIPALLFEEMVLSVEEVVSGEICEIVEYFGFNKGCTELLAYNAVKFWTAARLLEWSQETTADNADTADTTAEGEEMSNIFKKATTLPIIISFTHSVSKARDYYGCPRITAECQALNFKAAQVGYGYDMIGALMSEFVNSECTQYAIEAHYAFNELRGNYNPIRYNEKTDVFRVNFCIPDVLQFIEDCGLDCKLVSKKNGQIVTCVISSK